MNTQGDVVDVRGVQPQLLLVVTCPMCDVKIRADYNDPAPLRAHFAAEHDGVRLISE